MSIISYEIAMQRKSLNMHLFVFVNCLKMCIFSMGVCNLHFRVKVSSSYVYPRPYLIIFFVKTHYNFMFIFIVEHLKINMKHTTLSYIYLTHILHFKSAPNIPVHTKLSILYTVFVLFCTLFILYIIICIICVLSLSFCHTVLLLSPKQIPRMCKHTWQ